MEPAMLGVIYAIEYYDLPEKLKLEWIHRSKNKRKQIKASFWIPTTEGVLGRYLPIQWGLYLSKKI